MEQKQRDRAKRAAAKGTNEPLFGEDGRARGMLDKYDEEGAAAGMRVGADGALEAEDTARRQAEIRARLAAGAPRPGGVGDCGGLPRSPQRASGQGRCEWAAAAVGPRRAGR